MMPKWSRIRKKLLNDPAVAKAYAQLPAVDIAAQLINARAERGLTQADLAKLVGTSQSAIARLERGNYAGYSLRTLAKIVNALGKPLHIHLRPRG